jgi:hypothetical protein
VIRPPTSRKEREKWDARNGALSTQVRAARHIVIWAGVECWTLSKSSFEVKLRKSELDAVLV